VVARGRGSARVFAWPVWRRVPRSPGSPSTRSPVSLRAPSNRLFSGLTAALRRGAHQPRGAAPLARFGEAPFVMVCRGSGDLPFAPAVGAAVTRVDPRSVGNFHRQEEEIAASPPGAAGGRLARRRSEACAGGRKPSWSIDHRSGRRKRARERSEPGRFRAEDALPGPPEARRRKEPRYATPASSSRAFIAAARACMPDIGRTMTVKSSIRPSAS